MCVTSNALQYSLNNFIHPIPVTSSSCCLSSVALLQKAPWAVWAQRKSRSLSAKERAMTSIRTVHRRPIMSKTPPQATLETKQ